VPWRLSPSGNTVLPTTVWHQLSVCCPYHTILVFAVIGRPTLWLMVLSRILLLRQLPPRYEVIYFEQARTNVIARAFSARDCGCSRSHAPPDDGQLEVALSALRKAVELDSAPEMVLWCLSLRLSAPERSRWGCGVTDGPLGFSFDQDSIVIAVFRPVSPDVAAEVSPLCHSSWRLRL